MGVNILSKIFSTGATELVKGVGGVIDNLHTSKEEKLAAELKVKELISNYEVEMEKTITDRWTADMNSDSWLSKNIRPMTLAFLVISTVLMIFIDAGTINFTVEEKWTDLLQIVLITVIGAYFGGNDLRSYKLEFVKENFEQLRNDLIEFWAYIERDEAPPMGWKDAKFAGKMYPLPTVPMISKGEVQDQGLVKEYIEISNKMKEAEQELLFKEAKIKEVMKDAEVMVDDDGSTPLFSWKTNKRGTRVFTCKVKD